MAVNIHQSIFAELADFLVTQPTLEELATYKVSPGIQQHIDDLLERNREEGPSQRETSRPYEEGEICRDIRRDVRRPYDSSSFTQSGCQKSGCSGSVNLDMSVSGVQ
jgi:hypothetical protein